MGFYVYDSAGYVGDLASIGGWATFRKAVEHVRSGAVEALLEDGITDDPTGLAKQLAGIKLTGTIEDTRKNLLTLTQRCKDCVIVTDGVGLESRSQSKTVHESHSENESRTQDSFAGLTAAAGTDWRPLVRPKR